MPRETHRETYIGGYFLRLISVDGSTRIVLRDLGRNEVIEFETWVAAWAYIDEVLQDFERSSSDLGNQTARVQRG